MRFFPLIGGLGLLLASGLPTSLQAKTPDQENAGLVAELDVASLLQNPDFVTGIDGWTFSGNCFQPAFDDAVGSPGLGALAINCFGGANLLETASQCVTLAAPARVDFSA